jgi:hypothetical protein
MSVFLYDRSDLLHTRYSSSPKAKARLRRQLREDRDSKEQRSVSPQQLDLNRPGTEDLCPLNESIMDRRVGSEHPGYFFSMADNVFAAEEDGNGHAVDLNPLPIEESIVSMDFDADPFLASCVSDDSFHDAMQRLLNSLVASETE